MSNYDSSPVRALVVDDDPDKFVTAGCQSRRIALHGQDDQLNPSRNVVAEVVSTAQNKNGCL
jgi:hypothetical protein